MQSAVGALVSLLLVAAVTNAAAVVQPLNASNVAGAEPVSFVCRGLHKAAVDWWLMLKHPAGYQYSYLDSSTAAACTSVSSCWRHGLTMLNPSPVAHTLDSLLQPQEPPAGAFAVYNDADPAGQEHWEFAHAKGVVAFDSSSGFWLQHSAPRFPGYPGEANFSSLGRGQSVFGQHFFCATLNTSSSMEAVAQHLLAAGPYIYAAQLPAPLAAAYPSWQQLVSSSSNTTAVPRISRNALQTLGGQPITAFAKSASLNASLEDWVVPLALNAPMLWETWQHGRDALPSVCPPVSPYSSSNINAVRFANSSIGWGWAADHSKWGVAAARNTMQRHSMPDADAVPHRQGIQQQDISAASRQGAVPVACLGDMNRAAWQQHRGGGWLCMAHAGLWSALHGMIRQVEPCSPGLQQV